MLVTMIVGNVGLVISVVYELFVTSFMQKGLRLCFLKSYRQVPRFPRRLAGVISSYIYPADADLFGKIIAVINVCIICCSGVKRLGESDNKEILDAVPNKKNKKSKHNNSKPFKSHKGKG